MICLRRWQILVAAGKNVYSPSGEPGSPGDGRLSEGVPGKIWEWEFR